MLKTVKITNEDGIILTVNDRLSAAALIKFSLLKGAALIRERRLFESGAYFNYG